MHPKAPARRGTFSLSLFALVAAASLFAIKSGQVEGIKCWVCQSSIDPKCADPFDNNTLPIVDCDAHPRDELDTSNRALICRKMRQKVNGDWRTSRSCGYLEDNFKEGRCVVNYANDIYREVCSCKSKDGCNSADSKLSKFGGKLMSVACALLGVCICSGFLLSPANLGLDRFKR